MRDLVAVEVAIPLFPKERFQLLHGIPVGGVALKQFSHHRGFRFVDHQPLLVLPVAEDPAVAQHHVLPDGLLMPELHAGGELAQLVLRDGGHDGEAKLRILVQRVDVVILEKDSHAIVQELPCVLDRVERVSGKTGDLLRDDQIEFIELRVVHHAVEVLAVLGGDAGKSFVDVAGHECPGVILADQIFIVANLVFQRVSLFIRFRGHAGIIRHPQRNVIEAFCAKLLPHGVYIHIVLLSFVKSSSILYMSRKRKARGLRNT